MNVARLCFLCLFFCRCDGAVGGAYRVSFAMRARSKCWDRFGRSALIYLGTALLGRNRDFGWRFGLCGLLV